MVFKFESLRCWQKVLELSNDIAEITKDWPKEEKFYLKKTSINYTNK